MLARAAFAGIDFAGDELLPVAKGATFMVAGDLNNDGLTDVVVIAPSSNEVDVYLADSTSASSFAPARAYHFGTKLGSAALGDLNGDDKLDLVVTDTSANSLWLLLGQGDGTFLTPSQVAVANSKNPSSVAIANFDNLGYNDLAVADSKLGRIFILRNDNNTPPRFLQGGQVDVGLDPEDIRAVNLGGHGDVDLVVLNLGGPRGKELDTVLWSAVNQGFPVFDTPQRFTIGANPSALVVADFNNDGLPDVAMLNRASGLTDGEIDVLIDAGGGVFNPPTAIPVPCPFFTGGLTCKPLLLAAGDFDGDTRVDLVVALSDPRHATLNDAMQAFGGRGDGGFSPGGVFAIEKAPLSMAVGDLTGDGKPDLAIANQRTLNLQAFVNVSTAGMTPDGESCLLDDTCLSGRCTDGVCCADQCDVTNGEKCNVPGRAGSCVPIPAAPVMCTLATVATDCGKICVTGSNTGAPCTGDSTCGGGKCQANPCVDDFCCDQSCEGGRCDRDGFQGVCIPSTPNGQACTGDNTECVSGFCSGNLVCCNSACPTGEGFCDNLGICQAVSPNGTSCQNNAECVSNICDPYDAICCNTQCDPATQVCFPVQGICQALDYTPGVGTPGPTTVPPTPTATATPRLTPVPVGTACSVANDCLNAQCVDGVCCQSSSCPAGEQCQQGSGLCTAVTATPTPTPLPLTPTISRTTLPATPTANPCGDPSTCPNGTKCEVINGEAACTKTSSGGGCSTGGDDPARGNLLVASLLPLALWAGRRRQLRRVRVRSRALRQ